MILQLVFTFRVGNTYLFRKTSRLRTDMGSPCCFICIFDTSLHRKTVFQCFGYSNYFGCLQFWKFHGKWRFDRTTQSTKTLKKDTKKNDET